MQHSDDAMKTLVVYFSRTGTTRTVAHQIAAALGADVEEIRDHVRRRGPIGWLRCGYEGSAGKVVEIESLTRDPAAYDLVVIGGPIWGSSVSSPVRGFLRRYRAALPKVAFFCTCGGRESARMFSQMTNEAERLPIATLAVRHAELTTAPAAVARFVAELTAPPTPSARPTSTAPAWPN
jgi:flavodoxin